MVVGRHFENGFIATTQPGIIRYLVCSCKLRFQECHMTKCHNFANSTMSTWQTAAIMTIVFGYIWTICFLINAKFHTKEHNYTQTQITWPKYSGSRHLNRDNKTANINVKNCSLSTTFFLTAKWHIENSKNNERWYYFRSTLTVAKCC